MRRKLVDELRVKGIKDERVLSAFDAIPRHFFLDGAFEEKAYTNIAFQIGAGQTISHPYTVAFQSELLAIQKGDKILEIGSGSGFQTCILCQLGARVYSIERQKELHLKAKRMVQHFGFTARLIYGDGYKGIPAQAPFDKIIITCGAPDLPQALLDQLKPGGVMVIPIGEGKEQLMKRILKNEDGSYTEEEYGVFRFVPMLEDKAG